MSLPCLCIMSKSIFRANGVQRRDEEKQRVNCVQRQIFLNA